MNGEGKGEAGESRDVFTRHGLRNTKHRELVYGMLLEADEPLTAEGVYLKLREAGVPVSFSTVYRILDAFAQKGLAERAGAGDRGRAAFEAAHTGHRHRLICTECRRTVTVEDCPLGSFEKALESATQFDITEHRLELFGLCPACKGKAGGPAGG